MNVFQKHWSAQCLICQNVASNSDFIVGMSKLNIKCQKHINATSFLFTIVL